MSAWEDLSASLDGQQRGVTQDLTELFSDLWDAVQARRDLTTLLDTIERAARVGVFKASDTGARLQHSGLRPGVRHPQALVDACEQLAVRRAAIIRERAQVVLTQATEALVSPYARLAAQVLVTDAARAGVRQSAVYDGATHKTFVCIRQVHESRAHSRLEGTVLPIDEPFIIAGLPVHGPGDPALPWSERAWCGHALEYLRRAPTRDVAAIGKFGAEVRRKQVAKDTLREAQALAEREGIPAKITSRAFRGYTANAVALYDTVGTIFLNPLAAYWSEADLQTAQAFENGIWSTATRLHVVHHEVGHAKHHDHAPGHYLDAGKGWSTLMPPPEATKVSRQATLNPREFVAEVYAARRAGIQLDQDVLQLYTVLGGPP